MLANYKNEKITELLSEKENAIGLLVHSNFYLHPS